MIWWLMLSCLVADCQPARLFLNNGKSIWTECGWTRQGRQVVLRFSDGDFLIEGDLVDWPRTKALQTQPTLPERHDADMAERDWQALVRRNQTGRNRKPVVLTNKILNERKQAGLGPRKKPKQPTYIKDRNVRKLQAEIREIRQMQTALRMQLRGEITWRQAQHLVVQIDILEKRWREKQYWVDRYRKINPGATEVKKPANPSKPPTSDPGHPASQTTERRPVQPAGAKRESSGSLAGVETGRRWLYNAKICATLFTCYTYQRLGVDHGQPHPDHRGPRA